MANSRHGHNVDASPVDITTPETWSHSRHGHIVDMATMCPQCRYNPTRNTATVAFRPCLNHLCARARGVGWSVTSPAHTPWPKASWESNCGCGGGAICVTTAHGHTPHSRPHTRYHTWAIRSTWALWPLDLNTKDTNWKKKNNKILTITEKKEKKLVLIDINILKAVLLYPEAKCLMIFTETCHSPSHWMTCPTYPKGLEGAISITDIDKKKDIRLNTSWYHYKPASSICQIGK